MELKNPDIRYLNDLKTVLFDKEWGAKAKNFEAYYMYRGIEETKDLRYDITIIPPKMLGKEYIKTKGHEHIDKYGELYTVLEGQAIYLMQRRTEKKVEDVYAVNVMPGEVVVIPSFYGHVTYNPSISKPLKMANWISKNCKSAYDFFGKMQGGCYFYTKDGWIKNENYQDIPKLRFEKPLKKMPDDLSFLND